MLAPWKKSYEQPSWHIKKQRHYFANKGPSSQSYGFSSGRIWMWELDHKESWAPKNWRFWTVVLEKTFESSSDSKEIKLVNPKGNQSWIFTGRTDAKAGTPILWPPDVKNWLIWKDPDAGKDWGQEEKGTTEDEMVGWHQWLDGHEFEQAPGVGDGQGNLVLGISKSQTRLRDWMELNWTMNIGTIKLRATSQISLSQIDIGISLVALMVKNLPAIQETQIGSQGWEDPLEKGMTTHSSILAWRLPWTEEPCGLQSLGSRTVGHDRVRNIRYTYGHK